MEGTLAFEEETFGGNLKRLHHPDVLPAHAYDTELGAVGSRS